MIKIHGVSIATRTAVVWLFVSDGLIISSIITSSTSLSVNKSSLAEPRNSLPPPGYHIQGEGIPCEGRGVRRTLCFVTSPIHYLFLSVL